MPSPRQSFPIMDINQFKARLLNDLRVELTDEFDRNFTRKGFFKKKWKPRKNPRALGSLLHVTGTLRRSIQSRTTQNGVLFTSNVPYAVAHNEGFSGTQNVREHTRRNAKTGKSSRVRAHQRHADIPERRFIGPGKETDAIIEQVIDDNMQRFSDQLTKSLKK